MKTYLTGASGFLGSYLIKKLPEPVLIPHQQIHSIKLENFDHFYFLSSYGNLSGQNDIEQIIKANITDLTDILLQINWAGVKSFLFVSTSSVDLSVQTMYSRCKKAAEEILLSFADKYQAPICIIRPFSITGPGEQDIHLIPRLIDSCFTGAPLEFVANPRHDFIDVRDVAAGILALSNAEARGIFELGTGKSYSNQEVLDIIQKVTGKYANIKPGQARPYDTKDWVCDDFKAREYDWHPEIPLEQTIREMVHIYEESHK